MPVLHNEAIGSRLEPWGILVVYRAEYNAALSIFCNDLCCFPLSIFHLFIKLMGGATSEQQD